MASRSRFADSARNPPSRDDLSPRERLHRRCGGGRAVRPDGTRIERARRFPAAAARAARAPDTGHRRLLDSRRREDRRSRHQFSADGQHDPHALHRAGTGGDRRALRCASALARGGHRKELALLYPEPSRNRHAAPADDGDSAAQALPSRPAHAKRPRLRRRRRERRHRRVGSRRARAAAMPFEWRRVARWRASLPRSSCATGGSGAVARPSRRSLSISPATPTAATSSGA